VGLSILTAGLGPLAEAVPRWLPIYFTALALLLTVPFLWPPARPANPTLRLLAIVLFAAAIRAPLLTTAPSLSDDVYRYVWEGRVVALGGDPFDHAPDDLDLGDLIAIAPEWPLINHPDLPALYPAGAQWFFALVTVLNDTELGMRVAMTLVDLLLIIVLGLLLLRTRGRVEPLVLYAWHPLAAVEVASSGHYEPLAILPMAAGLLLMHERRPYEGWLAWGFALAAKYLGALPALFALVDEWRRYGRRAAADGVLLVVSVIVVLSLPFSLDGQLPIGSLGAYAGSWAFNGALHTLLEPVVGFHPARWICIAGFLGWVGYVLKRRMSPGRSTAWVFVGLLYLSPVVHPWYGLWLLALLPLFPSLFAALLTGLLPLAYLAWSSELSGGPFVVPEGAWRVEYGLPLVALLFDRLWVWQRGLE
jgi:hypothetical protein